MNDLVLRSQLASTLLLTDRVAVVSGAGAGLGRAIALELAALGARVAVLDAAAAAAETTAQQIAQGGGRARALACDVADARAVGLAVGEVLAAWGDLDIVVNCAGVASRPGMPFTNNTAEDWSRTLSINLMGAVHLCGASREALLRSSAGRIINIASITGVIAAPYMPPYSVSKSALIGFTRVLARELAPLHVTANAVCPGFIRTPMWDALGKQMAAHAGDSADTDVFADRVRQHVPMQRPQTAEDVAACVAFLAGSGAANITGQVIGVDGGVTI